jgi:putative transposase
MSKTLKVHPANECLELIWIPKNSEKALFENLRQYLGEIFRDLATHKECKVIEGF